MVFSNPCYRFFLLRNLKHHYITLRLKVHTVIEYIHTSAQAKLLLIHTGHLWMTPCWGGKPGFTLCFKGCLSPCIYLLVYAGSVSLLCPCSVLGLGTPRFQSISLTSRSALQRNLRAAIASSGFSLEVSGMWGYWAYLDVFSNIDSWHLLQAFHLVFWFDGFKKKF